MNNTYKADGKVYMFMSYYGETYDFDACEACDIKTGSDSCERSDCMGGYFVEDNFKEQIKEKSMNKDISHKHAELIKLWADGAVIEVMQHNSSEWEIATNPLWYEDSKYRIQPEKVYPKTSLSDLVLFDTYNVVNSSVVKSCRDVADAAIEHFIRYDIEAYLSCNK